MRRIELPSKQINEGFFHRRAARGETFHVSLVDLDGTIPGHPAVGKQVLVVALGRVVCSTRDEEVELGVGEAVEWQEGEWHETRSLEKSRLLLIEGAFE